VDKGRYHGDDTSGTYQHLCKLCNKTFPSNSHLKTHMRVHTGEKPFECVPKGRYQGDDEMSGPYQHIPPDIPGPYQHICKLCKKSFLSNWHLKTHMRVHTGEKPFECAKCGKCFKQKGHLNRHMVSHYEKEIGF
ncbi:zinc finger protein 284-like, partial [Ruditapes philippinarum]|uniref:zinc finger protein 284-like n=1 Tax=Ruditapes philippinarum TaxID=129788 RepID=UPI00295A8828